MLVKDRRACALNQDRDASSALSKKNDALFNKVDFTLNRVLLSFLEKFKLSFEKLEIGNGPSLQFVVPFCHIVAHQCQPSEKITRRFRSSKRCLGSLTPLTIHQLRSSIGLKQGWILDSARMSCSKYKRSALPLRVGQPWQLWARTPRATILNTKAFFLSSLR